jgi:hypothetical protein
LILKSQLKGSLIATLSFCGKWPGRLVRASHDSRTATFHPISARFSEAVADTAAAKGLTFSRK